MTKDELLLKYKQDVDKIRHKAKKLNISDEEIDTIFEKSFLGLQQEIKPKNVNKPSQCFHKTIKLIITLVLILLILYVILNIHQATSSIVLRNIQNFIYPVFKVLRYISVPILKQFPGLSELYDESCLVENPFFHVNDMECWPCENVYSVLDLTGYSNQSLYPSGVPYIVKTKQQTISYSTIQELILEYQDVVQKDAYKIKTTDQNIKSINDLLSFKLNNTKSSKTHISWRINRMAPVRLIRSLFPRPYFISERTGQSIERYIMIDESHAESYMLPSFECSYILVVQGYGERTIVLKPSKECGNYCKTVSVVLRPSYVLWYNWWYWRPISLPMENASDYSISYVTSYC